MARLRVLGENPPPPRGNGENQLRELRDYLTRLKDELEFLMTHLGEDNFAESLATWVTDTSKSVESINASIDDINGEIGDINTALAGKQDTLTFDDTPTSGSENPVKSSGIYDALQRKVNPNLLTNAYFIGGGSQLGEGSFPINQRGQTSYIVAGYCIDRWSCERATHTLTLNSDYIRWERITTGYNPLFYQPVKVVQGEVYTYSILYRSTFRKLRETFTDALLPEASDWTLYSKTATVPGASANIGVQDISYDQGLDDTGKYIEIKAIKLELGSEQTLAHQENGAWVLNEIPDYWKEISTCQRYLKTITAWTNIYAIRVDNNNVYFFIPGQMAQNPSTLSSQAVYIYSSSGTNYSATANITFTAQSDGVMGQFARGSVPGGSHGSLAFSANAFISAE